MKAARYYGPGDVRVEHIPEPQAGHGQVKIKGIGGRGGGLAEYIAVDEMQVMQVDVAACTEPLAVAYSAVKRGGFIRGQRAAILGAGPIGLFVLKVLRFIDPDARIFVSEPLSARRALALKHGASLVIDPRQTDVISTVLGADISSGHNYAGVDVTFECAGVQASIDAALRALKPRGCCVVVSLWEHTPNIDLNLVLAKELVITGSMAYDRVHKDVIKLMESGKLSNVEDFITSRIALDNVVEEGFEKLVAERDAQGSLVSTVSLNVPTDGLSYK
ncbi:NAD(P)-binding protein [Fistulina hepatica ATCC 64428]|nr:NAD(P)-binding protein [Fistulina hepatica ATCC 64428]